MCRRRRPRRGGKGHRDAGSGIWTRRPHPARSDALQAASDEAPPRHLRGERKAGARSSLRTQRGRGRGSGLCPHRATAPSAGRSPRHTAPRPGRRGPPDTIGTGRMSGRTNGATPAHLPITAPARTLAGAAASSLTPSRRFAAPGRVRPWWCRRRCSLSRHPRGTGAGRSGRCPSGNHPNVIPCT